VGCARAFANTFERATARGCGGGAQGADRRREARLETERLKKHQEALQKRFDAGQTSPR
jgi:hypothetical protein